MKTIKGEILIFNEQTKHLDSLDEFVVSKNGKATQITIPAYLNKQDLETISDCIVNTMSTLNKVSDIAPEVKNRIKLLSTLHHKICEVI